MNTYKNKIPIQQQPSIEHTSVSLVNEDASLQRKNDTEPSYKQSPTPNNYDATIPVTDRSPQEMLYKQHQGIVGEVEINESSENLKQQRGSNNDSAQRYESSGLYASQESRGKGTKKGKSKEKGNNQLRLTGRTIVEN